MRRSIATVSLSGMLRDKLAAAAAARFDAVEIFENDLLFYEGSPRQVREIAADLGLRIALYQPFRDLEGVSDAQFARNLERAERKFDVMQQLGAPLVLVCSNAMPQAIDDDARAAAQLHAMAERAARRGLRVGYEALAWGTRVNTFSRAWRLIEMADHPHLGLILDSFHTLALGDDPAPIASIPGDRIFFVQLADAPRLSMDVLSWSRHYRCFPGQGDLDVAGLLAKALEAGYSGPISLEVFNDDFRAIPNRSNAVDGMRSLLYLEEQVRRRETASPAIQRVELFHPPAVPTLQGVAFLEVAVDHETGKALAKMLALLGFQRVGHHRSKDVTLFRQGTVNIVLNAEPDSFAHSYFLVHGPAVCAIGLKVSNAAQALGRAEALGCQRYDGRLGPQERSVPAIRALDGSLIYLVESAAGAPDPLDVDFLTEPAAATQPLGLVAIDHLAQALPPGQLDSWILFYRAVFGLEPESPFVLADPHGIVRSRAMADPSRSVRMPLNISGSRNTGAARSVSTFAGAGVSHIAFRTDDLFATADRLIANGLSLLPIPENYYADLGARFGIDEARLDGMRRRGILYDQTESGAYLQLYTESFADRFFFEIVERVGDYDQYGAANAPARMAAQARSAARATVIDPAA